MPPRPYFNMTEALSFAWKTTLDNWTFLVPVVVVYFLASGISIGLISGVNSNPVASLVGLFVSLSLMLYVYAGMIRISLAYVDGQVPNWSLLWSTPFNRLATLFVALLLVGIISELGLILLIFPGLYLAYYFSQVKFLVLDANYSTTEALKQSGTLTHGVKLPILGFSIVSYFIIVAGFFCFGFGVLIALPVVLLAEAMVYRQLVNSLAAPIQSSAAPAAEASTAGSLRAPLPPSVPLNPAQAPIPQPMSPPPGWLQAESPTQPGPAVNPEQPSPPIA